MNSIKIHNPQNEFTVNNRFYNYFFNQFTKFLSDKFKVYKNDYFKNAHIGMIPITLENGIDVSIFECEYIIENLSNGEFVVLSISDVLSPASMNFLNNPLLKKVLISQYNPKLLQTYHKISPWVYFPYKINNLNYYYLKRQKLSALINKMYFKGTSLNDRTILSFINDQYITDYEPIDYNLYFNDIINYKIGLSVDGVGEFCYRDIECFALGVPIIRYEYISQFKEQLIPNFHYISIERPSDMSLYRLGNKSHSEKIIKRYNEVKHDEVFLNFISKNAREYYENNCTLLKLKNNTYNYLELKDWE